MKGWLMRPEDIKEVLKSEKAEEDRLSDLIVKSLKRKDSIKNVEINSQVHILKKIICGVQKGKIKLLFQSSKQDIVFYISDPNHEFKFEGKEFFSIYDRSLPNGLINIPLVIFEIKRFRTRSNTITNEIENANEMADKIKAIFPFCMYNLIMINFASPNPQNIDRYYVSANRFDRVIYVSSNNAADIIYQTAMEHIDIIRHDPFFRVENMLV
jgi:hypothetical protein